MAHCVRILKHENQNDNEFKENEIVEIETLDCKKYTGRIEHLYSDCVYLDTSNKYSFNSETIYYNNIYEIRRVEDK